MANASRALALLGCALALVGATPAERLAEAELAVRARDPQRAAAIWSELAERGNAEAQYRLGVAHRTGTGVPLDYARAVALLERASKTGHADALFALAALVQKGRGTKADRSRALALYEQAAELGHAGAKRKLAAIAKAPSMAAATGTRELAPQAADPNAMLARALAAGDVTLLRDALARGADAKARAAGGRTPLHAAASITGGPSRARAALAATELLLRYRAPVDVQDDRGLTPLAIASELGNAGCVSALAGAKAKLGVRDRLGFTPLMLAAREGHAGVVRELLRHGASASESLPDGRNALDLALAGERDDVAALLRARNVHSAREQSEAKRHASWVADSVRDTSSAIAGPPLVVAAARGQEEIVAELLQAAPDRNRLLGERDGEGHSALTRAALAGHAGVVRQLLAAGADVETESADGRRALAHAAGGGHLEVVDLLLARGAGTEGLDRDGRSALSHAAERGSREVVERLLARGARLDAEPLPKTPIVVAARAGNDAALSVLASRERDATRLGGAVCAALAAGHGERITALLLDAGAVATSRCDDERTPLEIAVSNGDAGSARRLLRAGADARGSTREGTPLVHVATLRGTPAVLVALLDAGADPDVRGDRRETALLLAAREGHVEIARTLLERGARAGARDDTGERAIDTARRRGDAALIELLERERGGIGSLFGS